MMKARSRAFLVALAGIGAMIACKQEPVPTTGVIAGTVTMQVGMSGDLNNVRVAIYQSFDDWANDRVVKFTAGTGQPSSVSFTIDSVVPGNYYLDAWKDVDNSGSRTPGDLFGVHGTTQWPSPSLSPVSVAAGETASVDLTAIVVFATTGALLVNSVPTGAAIWLDDSSTGYTTSHLFTELPAGKDTLKLTLGGYRDWEQEVTIVAGETTAVNAILTAIPTTGTITGAVMLQAGLIGDLNNIRVAIYASWDDWNNDRVIKYTAGTGAPDSVTFTIDNVVPDTYYLDAWKDMDNSGSFTSGDLFGVYGTTQYPGPTLSPFSVAAGDTTTTNVIAIVL